MTYEGERGREREREREGEREGGRKREWERTKEQQMKKNTHLGQLTCEVTHLRVTKTRKKYFDRTWGMTSSLTQFFINCFAFQPQDCSLP